MMFVVLRFPMCWEKSKKKQTIGMEKGQNTCFYYIFRD